MSLFEGYERSFLLEFFLRLWESLCVIMCEDSFKKKLPTKCFFFNQLTAAQKGLIILL